MLPLGIPDIDPRVIPEISDVAFEQERRSVVAAVNRSDVAVFAADVLGHDDMRVLICRNDGIDVVSGCGCRIILLRNLRQPRIQERQILLLVKFPEGSILVCLPVEEADVDHAADLACRRKLLTLRKLRIPAFCGRLGQVDRIIEEIVPLACRRVDVIPCTGGCMPVEQIVELDRVGVVLRSLSLDKFRIMVIARAVIAACHFLQLLLGVAVLMRCLCGSRSRFRLLRGRCSGFSHGRCRGVRFRRCDSRFGCRYGFGRLGRIFLRTSGQAECQQQGKISFHTDLLDCGVDSSMFVL